MATTIKPHEEPAWHLDDPRYVANYLIDEIEYLAFQMKALIMRLENLESGILKLRAMKYNTLINVILDFIESWDGNVFSAKDVFKSVGINCLRTKNKVFSYLSTLVRQGRIYKTSERGVYSKIPQAPSL